MLQKLEYLSLYITLCFAILFTVKCKYFKGYFDSKMIKLSHILCVFDFIAVKCRLNEYRRLSHRMPRLLCTSELGLFWDMENKEGGRRAEVFVPLGLLVTWYFVDYHPPMPKNMQMWKWNHLLLYLLKYTGHLVESVRNNKNIPPYKEILRFIVLVFSVLFFHFEYITLLCCWQHFALCYIKPSSFQKCLPSLTSWLLVLIMNLFQGKFLLVYHLSSFMVKLAKIINLELNKRGGRLLLSDVSQPHHWED